ncbi:MAG: hypothetical protein RRC34_04295 [Lentisphaeria bacterium]|nr:hypothetical protein [Lentisphaeria bacterium]
MKEAAIVAALILSAQFVRADGLIWPTETKGIFFKKFGPPIESVAAPDGFTVTPAEISQMFAPRKFTIMIYADDTHYFVTRYNRKQTLKQAQLLGVTINGTTGAVEKQGLGLKILKTYAAVKAQTNPSGKESVKHEISQPEVRITGETYPLIFEGPELTDEQKRLVIMDWEYLLATVKKPVFLKVETLPREDVVQKTRGFEHAVTHVLKLDEKSQRQWLPPILQQRLGVAVEIEGRYHLVIHPRVTAAYKEILSQKHPWPEMLKKLDAFMADLTDPAKRQVIANDPQKAREMFFFYKMDPWDDDQAYTGIFLDDDARTCTMRRPSLVEFKTMDKLLYVEDPTIADIPSCFILSHPDVPHPYVDRWPPIIFKDGKCRVLMFPMP